MNKNLKWVTLRKTKILHFLCPGATHITFFTRIPQTCWTFLKSSYHSGYTVLANRAGWQVAGDQVPWESPDSSWCWVCVYLYYMVELLLAGKNFFFLNFFLLERTLKQEMQKWQLGPRGIWQSCLPEPPSCPGYPQHPSSSPSITSSSLSKSWIWGSGTTVPPPPHPFLVLFLCLILRKNLNEWYMNVYYSHPDSILQFNCLSHS